MFYSELHVISYHRERAFLRYLRFVRKGDQLLCSHWGKKSSTESKISNDALSFLTKVIFSMSLIFVSYNFPVMVEKPSEKRTCAIWILKVWPKLQELTSRLQKKTKNVSTRGPRSQQGPNRNVLTRLPFFLFLVRAAPMVDRG